jgi:hypothetical protein
MFSYHYLPHSHLRLFILLLVFLTAYIHSSTNSTDDFRWQDATAEVDSLPFKQPTIDSLFETYKVIPRKALRDLAKPVICDGETLVYAVSWGPFNAGYVVLTTDYDSTNKIISVGGKALSNNFISAFYKMRDNVISHIDAQGLYPLFFEQHLREGKRFKNDGWIIYDPTNAKIHVKERHYKEFDDVKFVHDYLSIFHFIRNKSMASGDTFTLPIYINKKVHPMYFKCKDKQTIEVDAGKYNCLVVEPKLVGDDGAFNKKDKIEIWLSDNKYPTPILIKSKIKVGSVCAKLVWSNQDRLQLKN